MYIKLFQNINDLKFDDLFMFLFFMPFSLKIQNQNKIKKKLKLPDTILNILTRRMSHRVYLCGGNFRL